MGEAVTKANGGTGFAAHSPREVRPTDHPLRARLGAEAHARPFMTVDAPARISHLALLADRGGAASQHALLAGLCGAFGIEPPPADATHFTADLGAGVRGLRLKWERHTEFATYTFFLPALTEAGADPFAAPAIAHVPSAWLESLDGMVLVAAHVGFEAGTPDDRGVDRARVAQFFVGVPLAGSRVLDGGAEVWSDFRIRDDGYSRFLVRDLGLREAQAGRLIQRVLEIETYRMMALLAFPPARAAGPKIAEIDGALVQLTDAMTGGAAAQDERGLLERLSRLSADIERLAAGTSYRFGAAAAYYALVEQRIDELREGRIEGVTTIGQFMERRLAPAMQTCQSVAARQEALALRVSRASQILRARVDIALEDQNRALLSSMDRRAQLQLRLQETVEGLSVVVLSYYLIGLLGHVLKAAKPFGVALDIDVALGVSVPIVVVLVWLAMRRLRRRLTRRASSTTG
ncbi:MAG: DUF3422 domain-containing protein [Alphaproteobacteria bacterium]|nr:DUF3422 domain-containing protein [Alphaproteobacteria bacterium]